MKNAVFAARPKYGIVRAIHLSVEIDQCCADVTVNRDQLPVCRRQRRRPGFFIAEPDRIRLPGHGNRRQHECERLRFVICSEHKFIFRAFNGLIRSVDCTAVFGGINRRAEAVKDKRIRTINAFTVKIGVTAATIVGKRKNILCPQQVHIGRRDRTGFPVDDRHKQILTGCRALARSKGCAPGLLIGIRVSHSAELIHRKRCDRFTALLNIIFSLFGGIALNIDLHRRTVRQRRRRQDHRRKSDRRFPWPGEFIDVSFNGIRSDCRLLIDAVFCRSENSAAVAVQR